MGVNFDCRCFETFTFDSIIPVSWFLERSSDHSHNVAVSLRRDVPCSVHRMEKSRHRFSVRHRCSIQIEAGMMVRWRKIKGSSRGARRLLWNATNTHRFTGVIRRQLTDESLRPSACWQRNSGRTFEYDGHSGPSRAGRTKMSNLRFGVLASPFG